MVLAVARALEGLLRVDNMDFHKELGDRSSRAYRKMKADLEEWLQDSLFTQQEFKYGAADISVQVIDLMYVGDKPQFNFVIFSLIFQGWKCDCQV